MKPSHGYFAVASMCIGVAAAAGCGTTVKPITGPDGTPHYLISCRGGMEKCLKAAAEKCKASYKIVHKEERSEAKSELLVKCSAGSTGQSDPVHAPGDQGDNTSSSSSVGQTSSSPVPTGAVGFRFGIDPKEAERVCQDAGYEWKLKEDRASCSGAPSSIRLQASCLLSFCSDKLCRVEIFGIPEVGDDEADWKRAYESIKAVLVQKYGDSNEVKKRPAKCGRFLDCILSGKATLQDSWQWKSGHQVSLRMRERKTLLVISLEYQAPAGLFTPL